MAQFRLISTPIQKALYYLATPEEKHECLPTQMSCIQFEHNQAVTALNYAKLLEVVLEQGWLWLQQHCSGKAVDVDLR